MQVPPRPTPIARRRRAAAAALIALLVAIPTALATAAPSARATAPRPAASAAAPLASAQALTGAELAAIVGGTCTTCDDSGSSGGGGGGTGSSGSITASGTPYWETYLVSLNSTYDTPTYMVSRINNGSDVSITGSYQYTFRLVRDVKFSGGFASFVSASVGGEVSQSTTATVNYPIPPHSYGKLFVRYHTERLTYYGRKYQPMSDGSRVVVGRDSGPYETTSTVLGYVTGGL